MAITGKRTAAVGHADDAEWQRRGAALEPSDEGLDGFQLAEALRPDERPRQIPLVFLSSEAKPANAQRAHELGALAHLAKPFDPHALDPRGASTRAAAFRRTA